MKAILTNRWFWSILGAIALGLLIWFVGPLVAIASWRPLGWWPVRAFFALLPLIVTGLLWWLSRRRAKKKNAEMMEALKPPPATGPQDHDEIAAKLREALEMLKAARLGSRQTYAYQLPWYAIIGPSGAGKTTALLNCGLNFPTAVAGEYRALRGQPNTPNCDWWFTDEAILIDTAGRYVTQDIDQAADAEGWRSFLDLLKQYRPLQALNGVIVAIPAPDFLDPQKMAGHAENVRARLAEISGQLNQDLPVYLLVTKADLISGFREYFARATDAESDQVLGTTAPDTKLDTDAVMAGFDDLVASVSSRVVDRMQNEPQLPVRGQIAAFPAQLASFRTPIAGLLGALGQKSRFDQPARVRGIYFASAIQTGNPVDRILLNAGIPAIASAHGVGQGRSYFLRRFFSDLIIPEQGLAGRNPVAERRAKQRYVLACAAAGTILALALALWTWGYFRNAALIDSVYRTANGYAQVTATRGGVDQDIAALGVLGDATDHMKKASDFGLGLGQGTRLASELKGIYGRDLQRRLMPLLVDLAEQRMIGDAAAPTALYDDLKSYLILGGRGPTIAQHVVAWVQPAWVAKGGAGADMQAGELARHAAAMFDGNFKPMTVDTNRIEAARTLLRAQPASVRVYGRLKGKAMESNEPLWTASRNAGPQPQLFFAPTGAFAPGAGVPMLFTREGYTRLFLPLVSKGPELLEEEKWVVGDTGADRLSAVELSALKQDLERLYFGEFLTRWQTYLGSIQLKPVRSLAENVQRLRDGSGPLSPIGPLLRAIAKVTDMTPSRAAAPRVNVSGGLGGQALGGIGGAALDAAGAGAGTGPRYDVVAAFLPLRMFVGPPGEAPGSAPVDALMTSMTQLADKLNMIAVLPGGGGEAGSAQSQEAKALLLQIDQNANGMPAPVGSWAKAVASDASVALGGARLEQFKGALDVSFGESCTQILGHAFPTQPAATADLSKEDFVRFFSPNGQFAKFVQQEVASYIDTTGPEWKAKDNAGEIGLTTANVRALQAAGLVTRTFFASDPNAARLSYQIEPVALSGATSVTLQVDGQTLTYDGKSSVPATFDWPGGGGASVKFALAAGVPVERTWPGTWAVFRMLKVAAIKAGASPAIGEGSLTQAGARFDFRVRTFAGTNPFVVDPFVKVACPAPSTVKATGMG
jgi:type VI secretion system protein ImpL